MNFETSIDQLQIRLLLIACGYDAKKLEAQADAEREIRGQPCGTLVLFFSKSDPYIYGYARYIIGSEDGDDGWCACWTTSPDEKQVIAEIGTKATMLSASKAAAWRGVDTKNCKL